jgi:cytochrome c-type biogenesis protein
MGEVTLFAAFFAGVISFVSPCVLPLIPGYLSFISGVSVDEMKDKDEKSKVLKRVGLNSIFFILGFSVVFILLGASATFLGKFLLSRLAILYKVAGVIIIIFGLHLLGLFKIPFLNYEKRFHSRTKPLGFLGAFLVGLAFAFGWTPCIGPILAGILLLASNQETVGKGIVLLSFYSLGLGIPFFLTGIGFNRFLGFSGWLRRHYRTIEILSGVFLILVGLLIFFNSISFIAEIMFRLFPWLSA